MISFIRFADNLSAWFGKAFAWLIIMMAAGPTMTTNTPGKMKITSGKIILTDVCWAFSSAICRRLTRIVSD